jgi:hypothetical protein
MRAIALGRAAKGLCLAIAICGAPGTLATARAETAAEAVFDEFERRLIAEYYEALRADEPATADQGTKKKDKDKGRGKGRKAGWVQGIPPGHLPPPGLCRAWLPDTPPGHQPAPGPCPEIARDLVPGARLVYGGARGKDDTLPPGLGEILPDDLVDELPLPYPDTQRVLVDDDVYLIRQSTRLILDVIENVLKAE